MRKCEAKWDSSFVPFPSEKRVILLPRFHSSLPYLPLLHPFTYNFFFFFKKTKLYIGICAKFPKGEPLCSNSWWLKANLSSMPPSLTNQLMAIKVKKPQGIKWFLLLLFLKRKRIVLKFYPYINCIKKKIYCPQYVPSNKGVGVTESYTGAWRRIQWWFSAIFLMRWDLVLTTGGVGSTQWKLEPNGDNKRTREVNSTRSLYSRSWISSTETTVPKINLTLIPC